MSKQSRLAVLVDGVPMPEDDARALWTKFSEHMDTHKGDFAGFAKLCGYVSVAPEARSGQAVLVVRTTLGAEKPQGTAKPQGAAKPQGTAKPQGAAKPQGGKPQAAKPQGSGKGTGKPAAARSGAGDRPPKRRP